VREAASWALRRLEHPQPRSSPGIVPATQGH
jgi:hypothetical protein